MRHDVQEIFKMTPQEKQVMMFSATLPRELRVVCKKFMQEVSEHSSMKRILRQSAIGQTDNWSPIRHFRFTSTYSLSVRSCWTINAMSCQLFSTSSKNRTLCPSSDPKPNEILASSTSILVLSSTRTLILWGCCYRCAKRSNWCEVSLLSDSLKSFVELKEIVRLLG